MKNHAGMIYVPPHERNGKQVKGYWRKKRGASGETVSDDVPVIDTDTGDTVGFATVGNGEIKIEKEEQEPMPTGERVSVKQQFGYADRKGTIVGYKTNSYGVRVAKVMYDNGETAYAPVRAVKSCEEEIPNTRLSHGEDAGIKENNGECHYVGVFVQRERLDALCGGIDRAPLEKPIASPHITLGYKPTEYDERLFGERVKVTITGYGVNDENEGVSVKLESDNPEIQKRFDQIEHPHITLSISKTGKAVNTKNVEFKATDTQPSFYMTYGGFFKSSSPTPKKGMPWESDGRFKGNKNAKLLWLMANPDSKYNNRDFQWGIKRIEGMSDRGVPAAQRQEAFRRICKDNDIPYEEGLHFIQPEFLK